MSSYVHRCSSPHVFVVGLRLSRSVDPVNDKAEISSEAVIFFCFKLVFYFVIFFRLYCGFVSAYLRAKKIRGRGLARMARLAFPLCMFDTKVAKC